MGSQGRLDGVNPDYIWTWANDVEEIATALSDQTDYNHRWLIDPGTGQVLYWASDMGLDGENPVEIDLEQVRSRVG